MNLEAVCARVCEQLTIDQRLVMAVATVESGLNPYAFRPEPEYRYLWDVSAQRAFRRLEFHELTLTAAPSDFPTLGGSQLQEWVGQRSSWGLMQVMGAVAREQGKRWTYLTNLLDPEENLRAGASHLRGLLKWSGGNIMRALAAYNGGKSGNVTPPYRNASYALKVLEVLERGEGQ